ncbi:hypothetical protein OV090_16250 [Nannocystis sp. RBIL2]|uniref:hypothetical protein n=1 Tax=Nannocystis sp. RBIL2 TaxID=2996788 RepID=UPI00226EC4AA|nr:hypothetical protein [Nannocystis sp. RBIL2]MCY1066332.1 hypothetical protein [Nannocystis sp. RBIL2]
MVAVRLPSAAVMLLACACARPQATPQPFVPAEWQQACLVDDTGLRRSSGRTLEFRPAPGRATLTASHRWGEVEPRIGELLIELPKAREGEAEVHGGSRAVYTESLQVGSAVWRLQGQVRWRDLEDGRAELALDLVMKGTDHKVSGTLVVRRVQHARECF